MDNPNRDWEEGSTRGRWHREREGWSGEPSDRPDWSQFGTSSDPGGRYAGPEFGLGGWREGFRGGFGNSGQLSHAAYNRGGLGAGYSEGPWGAGPGTELGWRSGWGVGPEGWERGGYARYGEEVREYPGYGGYATQRGYPLMAGYGERGYRAFGGAERGSSRGYPPGGWGGGRAQEGSWAERGYGTRGFSGGFSGHDYDWTRRGERADLHGGGWDGGFERDQERGPYTGRGPRGYQRSDERVYEEVCDRLTEHGAIDATEIEVRCEKGEVTLEGTVPDRQSKRLAEEIAESARGVRDVHNRLRVSNAHRDEAFDERESGRESTTRSSGTQRARHRT